MAFDHTAAYRRVANYAQSQLGEGGWNAAYNCCVTSFSDIMQVLGYADVEPQDWTNWEYGPGYRGPTTYDRAIAFVQTHPGKFPGPPEITYANPADTIAALDAIGSQRFPIACNFHCIMARNNAIPAGYETGLYHVSPVIRLGGGTVTILNVWHGVEETYRYDFFRAATNGANAGVIATFHRSIPTHHPKPLSMHRYQVRPGDTLSGIAVAEHVTLGMLRNANPQIVNPNLIAAGEVITIPN